MNADKRSQKMCHGCLPRMHVRGHCSRRGERFKDDPERQAVDWSLKVQQEEETTMQPQFCHRWLVHQWEMNGACGPVEKTAERQIAL